MYQKVWDEGGCLGGLLRACRTQLPLRRAQACQRKTGEADRIPILFKLSYYVTLSNKIDLFNNLLIYFLGIMPKWCCEYNELIAQKTFWDHQIYSTVRMEIWIQIWIKINYCNLYQYTIYVCYLWNYLHIFTLQLSRYIFRGENSNTPSYPLITMMVPGGCYYNSICSVFGKVRF